MSTIAATIATIKYRHCTCPSHAQQALNNHAQQTLTDHGNEDDISKRTEHTEIHCIYKLGIGMRSLHQH